MKKIKQLLLTTFAVVTILTLSACTNKSGISLQLENGDQDFLTSEVLNITNQTAFEAMLKSHDEFGINNGITALLDLVDYELLKGKFELNQEEIQKQVENYKEIYEEFDTFLITNGFETEENFVRYLELTKLREEAGRATIEITDEEIQLAYEAQHGTNDEAPALADVKEELREGLINQQLTMATLEKELARLRQEAGFVILDNYLQAQYISLLESYEIAVDEVFVSSSKTSTTLAAKMGEREYTADQLFNELIPLTGLSTAIALVDPAILKQNYEITDEAVNEVIDSLKVQLGDQFYPVMLQYYGLNGEQEIRDYITLVQLQEAAFKEKHKPTEARLQELYEKYEPEISARHILVEDEAQAQDIINQLENAEDKEATFIELAKEHGTDATATEGGDLGSFGRDVEFLEEFKTAVFDLNVGEFTTTPVKTEAGYHVIYVYDMETKGSFEEMREKLQEKEFARLNTATNIERLLLEERGAVNLRFTNPSIQARYEAIAASIKESANEE